MTREEKDLLLKDLCGRLSYGVNVEYTFEVTVVATNTKIIETKPLLLYSINTLDNMTVSGIDDDGDENICFFEEVKPYLFPLSSITAEQLYELREMFGFKIEFDNGFIDFCGRLSYLEMNALFEWFNRHHFDYRELISNGLAIDATGLNIYD